MSAARLFSTVFPVFVDAVMNPRRMAECRHRITRTEFPDYRELYRESDIRRAVAFLIFRSQLKCVVIFLSSHISVCPGVTGETFGVLS